MCWRGFTMVELLVTLAVTTLALTLAVPSFRTLLGNTRSAAALNQVVGAVHFARTAAIIEGRTVTLCPGVAGACVGRNQWHRGMLVFHDRDHNGTLDEEDALLRALPALEPGERIYWRSFRNRSYLQFHPRGYTRWQNGNFLYCPPDGDPRRARMVILNAQGRLRPALDTNGDGIAEDARGRALECP